MATTNINIRKEFTNGLDFDPVIQAFYDDDAYQCGYCTPGMIMSSYALLKNNPSPTRQEIRRALSGNLCRCTGYILILEAVQACAAEGGVN